jgi:small-conductance mechanosensitive channel
VLVEEIGELRQQLSKVQDELRALEPKRETGVNVADSHAEIEQRASAITVKLRARLKALLVLQQEEGTAPREITSRFFDVPPSIAIATYLEEEGEPWTYDQITKALVDGGAFIGNLRALRNAKTAVRMDRDLVSAGELVARKDWFKKGGKFQGQKLTEEGIA